ncbi:MAG: hypothetical protein HON62_00700, partial [Rhodospirillaceae bacterium]|nr:hypothetical protein [Rhodospirillaceae bacterium]
IYLNDQKAKDVSEKSESWAHEYAIIRLYREFEDLMLNCLVAGINNDTSVLAATTNIDFPKHLTDEVCEYIVIGNGYFDFRGRDGLIRTLKKYVPATHYLVVSVKETKYREALDRLSALRNFAAHDSAVSKRQALNVTGMHRMASAGSWLKKQGRFGSIAHSLKRLANDIGDAVA